MPKSFVLLRTNFAAMNQLLLPAAAMHFMSARKSRGTSLKGFKAIVGAQIGNTALPEGARFARVSVGYCVFALKNTGGV